MGGEWIVSGVEPEIARRYLEKYGPWRSLLQFDTGPRSDDVVTFEPFNRYPLRKLQFTLDALPSLPRNIRVLDIGFNSGYNALHLAGKLDAAVTGIDVTERHRDAASELAEMTGVTAEFLLASAEEFCRADEFDLVLHFGTLYHLPNPMRSLELAARSLKPGGWLALETVKYAASPDPAICKWIYGFNGDRTNFWALGEKAIEELLETAGLTGFRKIKEVPVAAYNGEMTRAIWVARKGMSVA